LVLGIHFALFLLLLPALALVLLAGGVLASGQVLSRWGSKALRTPLGVGGSGGGLGGEPPIEFGD
jgi:hypothetical protein